MKRIMTILVLIFVCSIPQLQAQKISSFNFSQNTQTVSGWINMHGNPAAAVISSTDGVTGFTVSSVAAVNWYADGGASSDGGGADGGTFFPAAVMKNHWFQGSAFYGRYNAATPQLLISGLNPDSVYTLKMTGSLAVLIGLFNLNPIRYSVAGAILYGYIEVNGNYNTSDGAVFHNIAPAADGKIKIYVNTADGMPTESNVASISGLQIIEQHSTGPTPVVAFTNPANNDVLPEDGYIVINATATETGGSIRRVEFFADTTKLGVDSVAPYSYTWLSPDPGRYVLKARAVDGFGNTTIATINVRVESLSSFWSMTGNIDANADSNFLGTVDTNRLALRTNNIERVSVLGDGNVGIGTKNTQGYKLAVNGSAIFTKVRIRAYAGWPDYVFKKNYQLPGIDSLEKYILHHEHLPGVTPAEEVKKNGMDIAESQAVLLKKIEELTLYLIREHKQVEKLSREVKRLKMQHEGRISKSNRRHH